MKKENNAIKIIDINSTFPMTDSNFNKLNIRLKCKECSLYYGLNYDGLSCVFCGSVVIKNCSYKNSTTILDNYNKYFFFSLQEFKSYKFVLTNTGLFIFY